MPYRGIHGASLRIGVLFVFAATPAHADLILSYIGVTATGSSLAGNPIAVGTPFEIDTSFSDAMTPITTGIAVVNVDSIAVAVGGAGYSPIIDSTNPSEHYGVEFYDATNPAFSGIYIVAMGTLSSGGSFYPAYTTATPPLDARGPTDTVFSGFLGDVSGGPALSFETSAGSLVLTYDPTTSLDASITSPEPGAFALMGVAFSGIALLLRRNYPLRRRESI